jgi:hypothetical protein
MKVTRTLNRRRMIHAIGLALAITGGRQSPANTTTGRTATGRPST